MRVLISVYDKTGLDAFAHGLAGLGAELVASGGTAEHLEELGLEVTRVDSLTDVPELLGGRVKTLHPRVHAGILARRDRDDDLAALAEHDIAPFDLVCVNLYPFERDPGVELIDVGGPAMLRAAAKNWAHVAALCRPEQYGPVLAELRDGGEIAEQTRRTLARVAFETTSAYDAAIAGWLAPPDDGELPERLALGFRKELDLAYGENPHQRAAYYVEGEGHLLAGVAQLQGRQLSFNNLNDLAGAVRLLRELPAPACVIVKHANPCGAAEGGSVVDAYERALACDPVSAYGGVIAVSGALDGTIADRIAGQFVEVLLAPTVSTAARATLAAKPALRVLEGPLAAPSPLDINRVPGGALVQEADADGSVPLLEVVVGELDGAVRGDLLFAWRVCKHVTSNAIVLARDGATLAICGGQPSRVDAVRIAVERARTHGHDLRGAVLASDAFFPFADGPQLALEAGVAALIQPGGSRRDAEVIGAVGAAGAAMAFTGRRHFRH